VWVIAEESHKAYTASTRQRERRDEGRRERRRRRNQLLALVVVVWAHKYSASLEQDAFVHANIERVVELTGQWR
jgi:hypothetical protein